MEQCPEGVDYLEGLERSRRTELYLMPDIASEALRDVLAAMRIEVMRAAAPHHRHRGGPELHREHPLDADLIEAAGLVIGEKVQIVNCNNGERIETYVIEGKRGSGQVCLNGPAARRCQPGDIVIVIAYGNMEIEEARSFKPTVVFPDTATNRLTA